MTRSRVVVTQRIHAEVHALLSARADVIANPTIEPWPPSELLDHAKGASALMVFMPDSVDDAFLAACPRLKIIAAALKGADNFDVPACTARGVWFTIVPDLLSEPTAELALALMLSLARNVLPGDRHVRSGDFHGWRPTLYGTGVRGSTIGIIGFGNVGQALARMLSGFQCNIIYYDSRSGDLGPGRTSLDRVLSASDFLIPLVPLTLQTFHLFRSETLAQMKRGAYLINVCRGSVVDEEAVADALESGLLAGYAADTFEMEDWARPDRLPTVSARLLNMPDRTLFTPHLGSAVASARLEIERAAANNILQALRGERPAGAINDPVPATFKSS